MDLFVIVVGLLLLMLLTMRKVPICLAALASVLFLAAFGGLSIVDTITDTYISGVAAFIKTSWMALMLGGLLSKLMSLSGATKKIAGFTVGILGEKRAIPAILLAGGLMSYGGISGLAACCVLYPVALSIFKGADLPVDLLPAAIASGVYTWVTMLPGSPATVNIISGQILGTNPMAAPALGFVAAAIIYLLTRIYFDLAVKRAKKEGRGFTLDEHSRQTLAAERENESLPGLLFSLLPFLCVFVTLNVFDAPIFVALTAGCLLSYLLFRKNLAGASLQKEFANSISKSAVTAINSAAIVGIGAVIKVLPGFHRILDDILQFGKNGDPVIIFAIATMLMVGLNASALGGLSVTLSVLAEPFMAMGVNPAILHRIGLIACRSLDTLPHSGGIVTILQLTGVSYKDGYKHLFVTTIVFNVIALLVCLLIYTWSPLL